MALFCSKPARSKLGLVVVTIVFLLGSGPFVGVANAAELQPRSLTMGNNNAGATDVDYRLQFKFPNNATVGSIRLMFCDDSALLGTSCNPPAGFDATNVSITLELGAVGFSVHPSSTANEIVLGRPPAPVSAGTTGVYDFTLITNPANPGPMYARVLTYPTSDGTGAYTDGGGLALYITNNATVTAEVPPYLLFCVGESIANFDCNTATEAFTDLGILTTTVTSAAQSQIVIATNAENGYSMWAIGGTMTSGSNSIAAMSAGGASVKGTAQFGFNLVSNTSPVVGQGPTGPGAGAPTGPYAVPNVFRYNSGDILATSPVPDDYRKYTVSYIVNIPANQPGGVYSTTLTYITLANF
ncbi:MAG TPA: hypothetical protein VLE73_05435 [Candidatus Saccharimonadales bacterium]|nr:hypothetical protein [Candidatus Saccharimonadales bacterium]